MAKEFLNIGCSPYDEDCAQVGSDDYLKKSAAECIALIHQLRRIHGSEPTKAAMTSRLFPHDFGSYREVICYYEEGDEESTDYALKVEAGLPAKWDQEALEEIQRELKEK